MSGIKRVLGVREMSDQRRDDSAFPQGTTEFLQLDNISKANAEIKGGLTKRELFAAMAMQGLTAAIHEYHATTLINGPAIALDAISIADSLLKELEK